MKRHIFGYPGLASPKCIYPNPTKRTVTGAHDRLHSVLQRMLSTPKEDASAHVQA